MTTRLLLVRHGYSTSNESGRFTGQLNLPLNETGRIQAARLADYLHTAYGRVDAIYSSDLHRAVDTVAPYAEAHSLPVIPREALREVHGGVWQGMTAEEIRAQYPEAYRLWKTQIGLSQPTGGESVAQVYARITQAVEEIAQRHRGETVIIATHAVAIRSLLCRAMGKPLSEMHALAYVRNASVTELTWAEDGTVTVVQLGYDKHLQGLETALAPGF